MIFKVAGLVASFGLLGTILGYKYWGLSAEDAEGLGYFFAFLIWWSFVMDWVTFRLKQLRRK